MDFPAELKYTKDHEWISLQGDTALVGITEFAQGELGDIVFVEIETLGKTLEAGAQFGTVEAVKTVSDLFLPVAGTVTEINPLLAEHPELVNQEPYGNGWMIRIQLSGTDGTDDLMDAEAYAKLVHA